MIAQSCGAIAADISRSMQEKSVTPESAVVLVVRSRDNVAHCMTPVWIAKRCARYGGVALCEDRPVSSNAPGSEAIMK
jgi:hypothetical protein